MSASWVHKLNESDSRLYKEDVIAQALVAAKLGSVHAIRFLKLVNVALDSMVTFGVQKVPETVGIINAENPWSEFEDLLVNLQRRNLTGHAARDAIADISTRFDSDEWNIMCRAVLKKDLRCGVSEKTVNKICKKTEFEVKVFGCQLATSCEGRPEMKGIKRLEPKLDGVRVLMVITKQQNGRPFATCYSRNGKVFENFGHIESELVDHCAELSVKLSKFIGGNAKNGFVLDGEVVGKSFNDLMKQARRKSNVAASDSVFYAFDVLPLSEFIDGQCNTPLEKRIKALEECRSLFGDMISVDLLPHINVDLDTATGRDQFHRYCNDKVEEGFEGVMVKNLKAPYLCKRTVEWLKFKPIITIDLSIVSVEEGTGKYTGSMGAILCSGVDDGRAITVSVGSGFTDYQRCEMWSMKEDLIGRTVEIIADTVSLNQNGEYSLRFPRFNRFRDTFTGQKE